MKGRTIGILAVLVVVAAAAAILIPGAFARNGGREAQEEDVAVNALPEAVRATLLEACAGATPGEIEREVENGQVFYEADVVIDGVEYEVQVAEDGTLIGKTAEDDDEDADDDGDTEEDDGDEEEDD